MNDPPVRPARARASRWIEIGASLLALVGMVLLIGTGSFMARLRDVDFGWLGLALGITVLQFVLLAARWWFVADKLGVPLGYGHAIGEYYLSTLLNYVVPFGVFGDAMRAIRHTKRISPRKEGQKVARVVLAIVLERASGQMALFVVAFAVAPDLLRAVSSTGRHMYPAKMIAAALVVVAAIAAVALGRRPLDRFRDALRAGGRALFRPANLLVHLPLSFAVVGTHIALFVVAARSIGLELTTGWAIHLVPPVLVASSLPTLLGGFGAREAAAAGLFHLTGLSAADGAMISFVYGSVGILASVPGIFALPWRDRPDVRQGSV